jgi:hypothetical protein
MASAERLDTSRCCTVWHAAEKGAAVSDVIRAAAVRYVRAEEMGRRQND